MAKFKWWCWMWQQPIRQHIVTLSLVMITPVWKQNKHVRACWTLGSLLVQHLRSGAPLFHSVSSFAGADVEPAPSVWINVSPVGSPGSVNAAEVKEHAGRKQRGRPEPRVQIPAWISSGCWAPQWEGTLQGGAKKTTQDELSEHKVSLRTRTLLCSRNDGNVFSFSGQFEPAVCEWTSWSYL